MNRTDQLIDFPALNTSQCIRFSSVMMLTGLFDHLAPTAHVLRRLIINTCMGHIDKCYYTHTLSGRIKTNTVGSCIRSVHCFKYRNGVKQRNELVADKLILAVSRNDYLLKHFGSPTSVILILVLLLKLT